MTNKNLTGKQKKQVAEAVKKARPNGDGKVPRTAQQSIPFQQMFKDGICRVTDARCAGLRVEQSYCQSCGA